MRRDEYQVNLQRRKPEKKKSRSAIWRNIGIGLGALILSTVAINATDNIDDLSDSLLGQVITSSGAESGCPEGMVYVAQSGGGFCVDVYEASPNSSCPNAEPDSQIATRSNLENSACGAVSRPNAQPWRYIARHQAEEACARSGKRLPTNREWYSAALGTPDVISNNSDGYCYVEANSLAEPILSGSRSQCVSSVGAYDMIGNVWEWVDATVYDGELDGRNLPKTGYVIGIDTNGVPIETASSSDQNFNDDYFWIEEEGVRGMIRGGYFGNRTDAGQYAINVVTPPSFAGTGVGFRCVK
jgi:hypothetical protein